MSRLVAGLLLLLLSGAAAAAQDARFDARTPGGPSLVIESTTDLSVFEPIIKAFQDSHPATGVVYRELTTNELDRHVAAACEAGRFAADLVISSSVDQQVKLVNDGCALPAGGDLGAALPDWARWRDELFGLTYEPAVIVYNRAWFAARPVPRTRFDLIDLLRDSDAFRGKVGTYDIETSGVGYLFAFEDAIQASTWGRLVESLGRNDARTFCCTADILDRVADGRLLLGYNVLGSYALSRMIRDPRIGIVLPRDYTLVMARAGFVSRDARQPEAARAFIASLLTPQGMRILSGAARLFSPVDGEQALARLTAEHGKGDGANPQAFRPIALSPALLVGLDRAKRRLFLEQWRAAMPKSGG
ncbi:iron(III) transport system substrate-binding protein [Tistlia consotensis]|uniref:Iron(III) transport system substrate-binding protein n=1 Tax=Tistlia consotensis USBA 355 TaxID=560819 RepID=A0A1Y6CMD1_9PROT|nr:ABC transporter substrate-binding protein [Tistlia consotensis]SMF73780.1 iron(III) transport system substrate-binding protein [Tistlia consotensis USBA 355]SNS28790.1 iron(III) transport system substrate-binding protein [Tistlia consotensis]